MRRITAFIILLTALVRMSGQGYDIDAGFNINVSSEKLGILHQRFGVRRPLPAICPESQEKQSEHAFNAD